MLVLSRKENEAVYIGPDIRVTIVNVARGKARVGIECPTGMLVLRDDANHPDTQKMALLWAERMAKKGVK